MASSTRTDVAPAGEAILRDFGQTLAACSKRVDAFHLTLRTAARLGAVKGAICLMDPALGGKLVVRLSFGMEEASNKVLGASAPGKCAALEAFAENREIVVEDYAASAYVPTDLEERQGILGAAYLPIRSPAKGPVGLLIAVPDPAAPFDAASLDLLRWIVASLGESLDRLVARLAPVPVMPEGEALGVEGLFEAFRVCLNTPNIEELSHKTLEYCRSFTGSEFGFVGYSEPETGHLICPTMTRDIFAQCQVAGKTVVFEKAGGLGGWVLDQKEPLIANDPSAHPASVGTPPGHLPIRRFMGVPCLSQGRLMGMIALANKDTDYDGRDLQIASAFGDIYAAAMARFFSERELTESRNRFSSLYHEAPFGYQTMAPDGTILEINDTALQLLGRNREEIVGKVNMNELLTTTGKGLLAEQVKALRSGGPAAPVELHIKRPDGERLPVLQSVTAILDERGFLQEIRCTLVDLSLRKALRQTQDYLETLFKYSASPIMVWNPQREITRFNDAFERLSGYQAEEVLGKDFGVLLPEEGRAAFMAQIQAALTGARLESAEIPVQTKAGDVKTVLWNSSNLYSEDGTELLATVMQGVDITERKQFELALRKTNRALRTLSRGNEALVHAVDEPGLLEQICRILVDEGGYCLAWIGYVERDAQKSVRPVAWAGSDAASYVERVKVTWDDSPTGQGPAGTAIRTGRAQICQDIRSDPRFLPWREMALNRGYACNAAFPLSHDGEVLGVFSLYGARPNAFDDDEIRLLTELAGDLAFGIATLRTRAEHRQLEQEREHYLQQLKESMEATVLAIAATIEKRDPYTAGHQQRVARLAVAIAEEMGLSPQEIEGVHFGGLIHDIGKISVPTELLSKPGKLELVEYRLIQVHAKAGKEILEGIKFPWPIIDMVHQHHERLDGSGYPQGLKGDQIRLEARILAVADVVEAMSSFRPYRPAVGLDKALEEITRNAGRLYDPTAVAACVKVIERGFALQN